MLLAAIGIAHACSCERLRGPVTPFAADEVTDVPPNVRPILLEAAHERPTLTRGLGPVEPVPVDARLVGDTFMPDAPLVAGERYTLAFRRTRLYGASVTAYLLRVVGPPDEVPPAPTAVPLVVAGSPRREDTGKANCSTRSPWARVPVSATDDRTPSDDVAWAVWMDTGAFHGGPPVAVRYARAGAITFGASNVCDREGVPIDDLPRVVSIRPVDLAGNMGAPTLVVLVPE